MPSNPFLQDGEGDGDERCGKYRSTYLSQKVQETPMRHNHYIILFPPPQPDPRLPSPLLDRTTRRRPPAFLAIPPFLHEPQIHWLILELVAQDTDIAACIAGQVARLLDFRQRDDFHALL